jgi:hypothetical protein
LGPEEDFFVLRLAFTAFSEAATVATEAFAALTVAVSRFFSAAAAAPVADAILP